MITKIEINTTTPRYNVSFGERKVTIPQTCPGGNTPPPKPPIYTMQGFLFPNGGGKNSNGRGKNFWQKLLEALNKMIGSLFKF